MLAVTTFADEAEALAMPTTPRTAWAPACGKHYSQTKNLLVSYGTKPLGLF